MKTNFAWHFLLATNFATGELEKWLPRYRNHFISHPEGAGNDNLSHILALIDTLNSTNTLNWIVNRRAYVTQQLASVACGFAITNNGGTNFSTNASSVLLAGTAPPKVKFIALNAGLTNMTWHTVTNWNLSVTLSNGANTFTVQGYDRFTNALSGTNASITITNQ